MTAMASHMSCSSGITQRLRWRRLLAAQELHTSCDGVAYELLKGCNRVAQELHTSCNGVAYELLRNYTVAPIASPMSCSGAVMESSMSCTRCTRAAMGCDANASASPMNGTSMTVLYFDGAGCAVL